MAKVELRAFNLLEVARKIEDAANRIDSSLQHLDSIMSNVDSVWDDANSKQYLAKYEELKTIFPTFKSAIYGYSKFLNDVVETYRREFTEDVSETLK